MFIIRVKNPQSAAGRCWNVAQNVLRPIVVFTPIALKLTGVITWSWWWVLAPTWIGAAAVATLITGVVMLVIVLHWRAWWQRRRPPEVVWLRPASATQGQDAPSKGAPL